MFTKNKALKMAIEAIEYTNWSERTAKMETALETCKEALEQPSWKGLSDDELDEIVDRLNVSLILHCSIADFVNAIEAKLKEKNYG